MIKEPLSVLGIAKNAKRAKSFGKVGIIGAGMLGQEIIMSVARHGLEVVCLDVNESILTSSMERIGTVLDYKIDKWELTEGERRAMISRIKGTMSYEDLAGCDIVIEAIKSRTREQMIPIRKEIFKKIEEVVDQTCIIATNSTTLVITELSNELEYPERCVSFHFLSPVQESQVVEVVCGLYTSTTSFERVCQFAKMIDKRVVRVTESPGIISTRLVAPLINEACRMLMEGVGSVEDIDTTLKLGFGFPHGPFEMADKYGLDRVVRWLDNLYAEFGELHYKASPTLKKMVRGNRLGMVTRKGFYEYDEDLIKQSPANGFGQGV